ncbi:MAG: 2-oxoglutarate oxidoreductase [Candidatus Goldiibacteriota bacterium HGW-Goldbacteria-1]|jgi:2-oxoglutarate ferredoxin oxidoreductase subunit beta|nr:MAG: 2-oxoglutarate oxidoreductase [Candidatus Goldiibacteriota bacterium HGW-Goldbacteria-1]
MEKKIYGFPESLKPVSTSYCPGCSHSTVHKLIAEVIDELNVREKTIGVAPVGCAVFAYDFFNFDVTEAPHGRNQAVSAAIKRVQPDSVVFSYQGDGDLASIGMAETIHTANRGENITVIFINNTNYGMTGGQMAPTSLLGQVTTTSPKGRDAEHYGHPIKMLELLAPLEGVKYLERVKVTNAVSAIKAKKAIKKAFENQINNVGFSMIEVLGCCPANWKMDPVEANCWVDEKMAEFYPLGVVKDAG